MLKPTNNFFSGDGSWRWRVKYIFVECRVNILSNMSTWCRVKNLADVAKIFLLE
jgi:hypothetical protein